MDGDVLLLILAGLWSAVLSIVVYNLTQGKKDNQDKINTLMSEVAVLKEMKMDEAKTRQIIADSLGPLKQGQEELRSDMKNMLTALSNLSVQIAKVGLMRHRDADSYEE